MKRSSLKIFYQNFRTSFEFPLIFKILVQYRYPSNNELIKLTILFEKVQLKFLHFNKCHWFISFLIVGNAGLPNKAKGRYLCGLIIWNPFCNSGVTSTIQGLPVLLMVFSFDRSHFNLLNFRPETIQPSKMLLYLFLDLSARDFLNVLFVFTYICKLVFIVE